MYRRRRAIQVWPAVADLMTVLAVVGIVLSLLVLNFYAKNEPKWTTERNRLIKEIDRLTSQVTKMKEQLLTAKQRIADAEARLALMQEDKAKNNAMFQAIQQAQSIIEEMSQDGSLEFEEDQSFLFGEELVEFAENGFEPIWKSGGKERLHEFCNRLSKALKKVKQKTGSHTLFTLEVEGHTDAKTCQDDPECNWYFSSARAGLFVRWMKNPQHCPDVDRLELRAVGYADTRPPRDSSGQKLDTTRRISLRLVPSYASFMTSSLEH